jgi:excisionase family DNA binding protein
MHTHPDSQAEQRQVEPAFMTILDSCSYLGLSQASVYRLIGLGRLEAKKAGGRTLLTFSSLKALAAELPAAKIKMPTSRRRMGA